MATQNTTTTAKRRGRPLGSRNKPKAQEVTPEFMEALASPLVQKINVRLLELESESERLSTARDILLGLG